MQLRERISDDGVRVPTLVGLLVAEKDPTEVGTLTPFRSGVSAVQNSLLTKLSDY